MTTTGAHMTTTGAHMTTPEGRVSAALRQSVINAGGEIRKVQWQGRVGAPDWLVMMRGRAVFIETKAPGEMPRKSQLIEFSRIERASGIPVLVIDHPQDCASFVSAFATETARYIRVSCDVYTFRRYNSALFDNGV